MEKQTHNGWTNYATWRVNLEVFDGMDIMDYLGSDRPHWGVIAKRMKEYAENVIYDQTSENSIARDYALAFLADVNWYEIARHYQTEESEA